MKKKVVELPVAVILSNELILRDLRNALLSEDAKRLKREDPSAFCDLLAFYEEAERHGKEISRILARLGKQNQTPWHQTYE